MSRELRISVIGASGLVGQEVLTLLAERGTPVAALRAYATDRTAGDEVSIGSKSARIERLPQQVPACDVAFLCATADVTNDIADDLAEEGALVIDLSGALTEREDVCLVGPGSVPDPGLGQILTIADPASTVVAALVRAVDPRMDCRRVQATILRSVSTRGRTAIEGLARESLALLGAREEDGVEGVAFNVRPVEGFDARISGEVRRLIGRDLPVCVRTLWAPTFHGIGVSAWIEASCDLDAALIEQALREAPSVLFGVAPAGTRDSVGSDAIHCGDVCVSDRWLSVWAASDNLRLGAALSAVTAMEAATAGAD